MDWDAFAEDYDPITLTIFREEFTANARRVKVGTYANIGTTSAIVGRERTDTAFMGDGSTIAKKFVSFLVNETDGIQISDGDVVVDENNEAYRVMSKPEHTRLDDFQHYSVRTEWLVHRPAGVDNGA